MKEILIIPKIINGHRPNPDYPKSPLKIKDTIEIFNGASKYYQITKIDENGIYGKLI